MTAGNSTGDTQALRAEIKQTRADLGETVQALAAKADVKARVRDTAEHTKDRVRAQAAATTDLVRGRARVAGRSARRNPIPLAAIAAGAVAVVVVVFVLRGRRR